MAEDRNPQVIADWLKINPSKNGRPTNQTDAKVALGWKSDDVTKIKKGNLGASRDKLTITYSNSRRTSSAKRNQNKTYRSASSKRARKDQVRINKEIANEAEMFGFGKMFEEHDTAVEQYGRFGNPDVGSDDIENVKLRSINDKVAKDKFESLSKRNDYSWAATLDPEGNLVAINASQYDKRFSDPLNEGVKLSKSEVEQFDKFLKTGSTEGLSKATQAKFRYLTSEPNFKNKNGNNGDNGDNGLKRNGPKKNGPKNGPKRNGLTIGSGKTRTADQLLQIGSAAATGQAGAAAVGATTLGASMALRNQAVQRTIARQIAELTAKRGAKTAMKLIPGLDVLISGKETLDYLKRGQLDQAGIAALSGAIGWVPVVGDGASAALDLSNTALDIARLQYTGRKTKKPRRTRLKALT
jgi:hypothetical protein